MYGHHDNATLNADGWPGPTTIGRTIGIDTISYGVLTAIRLPDTWAGARFYFEKVRDRQVWDFALVSVASAMVMNGEGDAAQVNTIEQCFAAITPDLVLETAREYLRSSNRTILLVEPGAAE